MRGGALARNAGKRLSLDRLFLLKTRSMASGTTGRILVPSQDMMRACVRSTHAGDAKESSSALARGSSSALTPPSCSKSWNEMDPWHSNIPVKTLHAMRCDIGSVKMVLRSLDLPAATHLYETQGYMPNMHPVMMMRSNSGMSEMDHTSRTSSDDEQIDHLKRDLTSAPTAEKHHCDSAEDLFTSNVPSSKNNSEEGESTHHGDSRQWKQWWRELLKAFGLTVWVITGAVLVAKVTGVPNLGIGQHVAYTGFWGRSESPDRGIPSGVLELTSLNFNEIIMKRPTFVMFYAPWCPHCQRLHLVWEQLADVLNKKGYDVQLAIVDATKQTRLADKYEIVGFPSLIMFKGGHPVRRHLGARDVDTLLSFIDYIK